MVRGAQTVEQVITVAWLAEATAVHAPVQGDKAVIQLLNNLKRINVRAPHCDDSPGIGDD